MAPVAFFLSGAAGLIYEVCWIRRSSLIFGSTTQALSTVLAVLFLGLTLGSYGFGRLSHRFTRPLRVYALLELVLGALALASLPAFDLAARALVRAYQVLPDAPVLLALTRAGLVSAIVLVPGVLMGATLPLFCRVFVRTRGRLGRSVATLYAINTLGGAAGCALAGTVMLPTIGLTGSIAVGAGLSVAAGGLGLTLRRTAPPIEEEHGPRDDTPRLRLLVPVLLFVAGFTALAYEVLWTRFLALVVRNTVHTYTLTLSVVLVGIMLGSLVASRLADRTRSRMALFGTLQALAGLAVLATMLLPPGAWQAFHGELQIYAALMLPAAILSGASFPVGARLVVERAAAAGAGVGWVAALNTFGGIGGSLTAGFVLLPHYGLQAGVVFCTGLSVAAGIAAWWFASDGGGRRIVPIAAVAITWIALPFAMRTRLPNDFLARTAKLVDVREGLQGNLAVIERGDDLVLEIDRWWQGQRKKSQQIMAAHVPMLLHPHPRSVLVIGVGAGQTPSRIPFYDIERLDCVDIEPAVFDLVRRHFEAGWMDDPRVRIIADDGRNVIMRTPERYDVISMEVGQLFRPGVASFYTTDFYRIARAHLRPGGIVSQLLKLSLPPAILQGVVASFRTVFPQSVLWYNTNECLLLGINAEWLVFDRTRLALIASNPQVSPDFEQRFFGDEEYALRHPHVFLGGMLCGPRGLAALAGDARPFRDDPPLLDYLASRELPQQNNVLLNVARLRAVADPLSDLVRPPLPPDTLRLAARVRELDLGQAEAEAWIMQASEMKSAGRGSQYESLLGRALRANAENLSANRMMGQALLSQGRGPEAIPFLEEAARIEPLDPQIRYMLGSLLLDLGRSAEAVAHLRAAAALLPGDDAVLRKLETALSPQAVQSAR